MTELNVWTARTLRAGIFLGLALIVAGLLAGEDALRAGVLVLIASPLAGVLVTLICLVREKDWFWVMVAGILLAIVLAGVAVSILRRWRRTVPRTDQGGSKRPQRLAEVPRVGEGGWRRYQVDI